MLKFVYNMIDKEGLFLLLSQLRKHMSIYLPGMIKHEKDHRYSDFFDIE